MGLFAPIPEMLKDSVPEKNKKKKKNSKEKVKEENDGLKSTIYI
jgi:hypothetical protein